MVSQTSRRSNNEESKESLLLTKQENELMTKLLGERCRSLSTSIVQLFTTSPPDHGCWILRDTGVLCFVKDNCRKAYFFRIYCPLQKRLLWQHEMYTPIEYRSQRPFLHTFEGEDCMVAFNFSNEDEAAHFYRTVSQMRQRREKRTRNSMQSGYSNSTANIQHSSSASATQWSNSNGNSLHPNGMPQHQRSNSAGGQLKTPNKQNLSKKRTRNLTTRDISAPSDFKHVSHVGWDADNGFNIVDITDENLQKFFQEAGVSDKQLHDKETCQFIYDFLEQNGGVDAIRQNGGMERTDSSYPPPQPPPVPARIIPQQRAAPAPPSRVVRAPSSRAAPSLPSKPPPITPNVPPPPPPITNAFIPPPPPPPPISGLLNPMGGLPNPPPMGLVHSPPPPPEPSRSVVPDSKSALLESIKTGVKLKHVDPDKKPEKPDARNDLLSEIRQGVELRSVVTNAPKPTSIQNAHGLAGALARALAERSRAIHSDSDTSDTSSDDEWGED